MESEDMNYDEHLTQMIDALKDDKSIPQPYRNSVVSGARRLQMEIRGSKTMTNLTPPAGVEYPPKFESNCTCFPGAWDKNCLVHRERPA